jgi:hypothetical protein
MQGPRRMFIDPSFVITQTNMVHSSLPAHQASNVRLLAPPSSSRTATLRIHTAALAMTPMLTSSTSTNMARRRLRSSRASSPHKWVVLDGKLFA